MKDESGVLIGICRPLPDVLGFVTPVFRDRSGEPVAQIVEQGRVVSFQPVDLGEEFVPLKSLARVRVGEAALYAMEFEECIAVGPLRDAMDQADAMDRDAAGRAGWEDTQAIRAAFEKSFERSSEYLRFPRTGNVSGRGAKRNRHSVLIWTAVAASLLLSVILAFMVYGPSSDRQIVETAVGEWDHRMLADGTTVHVDARTRIKIDYTDQERVIHLYQGNAVFDVAKDPKRRFIVTTDLVDVTAVGTRFGVAIDSGVTATVSEGTVNVTVRGRADGEARLLRAGEQLQVSDAPLSSVTVEHVDAERTLEWTSGWLVLDGVTVAEAAEQFNRRNRTQIVVDSPGLGAKVVGFARVQVGAPQEFAEVVAKYSGVKMTIDKENGVIRLAE